MYSKTLLFLILISYSSSLYAQTEYLERLGIYLVGPENVDVFHDAQSEYYIEQYQLIRENILIEQSDNLEEISTLEKKRLKRGKVLRDIESYQEANSILDTEIGMLDQYLDLWSSWETPQENIPFLKSYDSKKCYQIDGLGFSYFPSDYRLDTLEKGSQIGWNEKVDQTPLDFEFELVEVAAAREEWVKKKADRNCLSAEPEDCLVWCMVKTPAEYDTLVIQKATLGCVDGFLLDKNEEFCERPIISEYKIDTTSQVKVMDVLTGREIRIKQFEVTECF